MTVYLQQYYTLKISYSQYYYTLLARSTFMGAVNGRT